MNSMIRNANLLKIPIRLAARPPSPSLCFAQNLVNFKKIENKIKQAHSLSHVEPPKYLLPVTSYIRIENNSGCVQPKTSRKKSVPILVSHNPITYKTGLKFRRYYSQKTRKTLWKRKDEAKSRQTDKNRRVRKDNINIKDCMNNHEHISKKKKHELHEDIKNTIDLTNMVQELTEKKRIRQQHKINKINSFIPKRIDCKFCVSKNKNRTICKYSFNRTHQQRNSSTFTSLKKWPKHEIEKKEFKKESYEDLTSAKPCHITPPFCLANKDDNSKKKKKLVFVGDIVNKKKRKKTNVIPLFSLIKIHSQKQSKFQKFTNNMKYRVGSNDALIRINRKQTIFDLFGKKSNDKINNYSNNAHLLNLLYNGEEKKGLSANPEKFLKEKTKKKDNKLLFYKIDQQAADPKEILARNIGKMLKPLIEKEYLQHKEVKSAIERLEQHLSRYFGTHQTLIDNEDILDIKGIKIQNQKEIRDPNLLNFEITDPSQNKYKKEDPDTLESISEPSRIKSDICDPNTYNLTLIVKDKHEQIDKKRKKHNKKGTTNVCEYESEGQSIENNPNTFNNDIEEMTKTYCIKKKRDPRKSVPICDMKDKQDTNNDLCQKHRNSENKIDHCKQQKEPFKQKHMCEKEVPCIKKEDPCKEGASDPCQKADLCKKQEDPCEKKKKRYEKDDTGDKDKTCEQTLNACNKKNPCNDQEDPCKKKKDPCEDKTSKKKKVPPKKCPSEKPPTSKTCEKTEKPCILEYPFKLPPCSSCKKPIRIPATPLKRPTCQPICKGDPCKHGVISKKEDACVRMNKSATDSKPKSMGPSEVNCPETVTVKPRCGCEDIKLCEEPEFPTTKPKCEEDLQQKINKEIPKQGHDYCKQVPMPDDCPFKIKSMQKEVKVPHHPCLQKDCLQKSMEPTKPPNCCEPKPPPKKVDCVKVFKDQHIVEEYRVSKQMPCCQDIPKPLNPPEEHKKKIPPSLPSSTSTTVIIEKACEPPTKSDIRYCNRPNQAEKWESQRSPPDRICPNMIPCTDEPPPKISTQINPKQVRKDTWAPVKICKKNIPMMPKTSSATQKYTRPHSSSPNLSGKLPKPERKKNFIDNCKGLVNSICQVFCPGKGTNSGKKASSQRTHISYSMPELQRSREGFSVCNLNGFSGKTPKKKFGSMHFTENCRSKKNDPQEDVPCKKREKQKKHQEEPNKFKNICHLEMKKKIERDMQSSKSMQSLKITNKQESLRCICSEEMQKKFEKDAAAAKELACALLRKTHAKPKKILCTKPKTTTVRLTFKLVDHAKICKMGAKKSRFSHQKKKSADDTNTDQNFYKQSLVICKESFPRDSANNARNCENNDSEPRRNECESSNVCCQSSKNTCDSSKKSSVGPCKLEQKSICAGRQQKEDKQNCGDKYEQKTDSQRKLIKCRPKSAASNIESCNKKTEILPSEALKKEKAEDCGNKHKHGKDLRKKSKIDTWPPKSPRHRIESCSKSRTNLANNQSIKDTCKEKSEPKCSSSSEEPQKCEALKKSTRPSVKYKYPWTQIDKVKEESSAKCLNQSYITKHSGNKSQTESKLPKNDPCSWQGPKKDICSIRKMPDKVECFVPRTAEEKKKYTDCDERDKKDTYKEGKDEKQPCSLRKRASEKSICNNAAEDICKRLKTVEQSDDRNKEEKDSKKHLHRENICQKRKNLLEERKEPCSLRVEGSKKTTCDKSQKSVECFIPKTEEAKHKYKSCDNKKSVCGAKSVKTKENTCLAQLRKGKGSKSCENLLKKKEDICSLSGGSSKKVSSEKSEQNAECYKPNTEEEKKKYKSCFEKKSERNDKYDCPAKSTKETRSESCPNLLEKKKDPCSLRAGNSKRTSCDKSEDIVECYRPKTEEEMNKYKSCDDRRLEKSDKCGCPAKSTKETRSESCPNLLEKKRDPCSLRAGNSKRTSCDKSEDIVECYRPKTEEEMNKYKSCDDRRLEKSDKCGCTSEQTPKETDPANICSNLLEKRKSSCYLEGGNMEDNTGSRIIPCNEKTGNKGYKPKFDKENKKNNYDQLQTEKNKCGSPSPETNDRSCQRKSECDLRGGSSNNDKSSNEYFRPQTDEEKKKYADYIKKNKKGNQKSEKSNSCSSRNQIPCDLRGGSVNTSNECFKPQTENEKKKYIDCDKKQTDGNDSFTKSANVKPCANQHRSQCDLKGESVNKFAYVESSNECFKSQTKEEKRKYAECYKESPRDNDGDSKSENAKSCSTKENINEPSRNSNNCSKPQAVKEKKMYTDCHEEQTVENIFGAKSERAKPCSGQNKSPCDLRGGSMKQGVI